MALFLFEDLLQIDGVILLGRAFLIFPPSSGGETAGVLPRIAAGLYCCLY